MRWRSGMVEEGDPNDAWWPIAQVVLVNVVGEEHCLREQP